jgi:hypothetical protein
MCVAGALHTSPKAWSFFQKSSLKIFVVAVWLLIGLVLECPQVIGGVLN